jgi:hypothetical protein
MGITKLAILPGFSATEQAGGAANSTQIRLRMAFYLRTEQGAPASNR